MKTKISKILGVVLSLALLTSLAVIAVPVSAAGDPDVVDTWENLNLPATVENTDVKLIEQAEDGTIFISVAEYFPGELDVTSTDIDFSYVSDYWANMSGTISGNNWDGAVPTTGTTTYTFTSEGSESGYDFFIFGEMVVDSSGNVTITITGKLYDSGGSLGTWVPYTGMNLGTGTVEFGEGWIHVTVGSVNSTYDMWSESMYKSDDGYMWEDTCISGAGLISAIEPSANYSADETVYVAVDTFTFTTIYRCTGAAEPSVTPGTLGQISMGEHGTVAATYVYDLDSYYDGDDVWLLAATDIDVFAIPDDNGLTTVWTDMELSQTLGGGYTDSGATGGVICFWSEFAPDFGSSGVIWAVYWDTLDTNGYGIISRHSGSTLWGTVITPEVVDNGGSDAKAECDIEFAADYSSDANPDLYAALGFWGSSSDDDIYSIECNFYGAPGDITPFDVNPVDEPDFCSLEVSGGKLVAGLFDMSYDTTEVWYSLNEGITWNMATKNPTGEADYTCNLLWSNGEGSSPDAILAATGGEQSAISISEDDGDTWNQIAFIDDDIDDVKDIAFDPTSTAAALITSNSASWDEDSLWKTDDVNVEFPQWQRVLCEEYSTTISDFDMVEYAMDGSVAMLYDRWDDRIYRSSDDLQTFVNWRNTASWGNINDWVVYDSSSVYAACTDGFWSTAVVGSDLTGLSLTSIVLQPGFDPDDADNSVLIVGGEWGDATSAGNVYVSYDAGDNLEPAYDVAIYEYDSASTSTFNGDVYAAFDADFQQNGLVYLATGPYVGAGILDDDGTFYRMAGTTKVSTCEALPDQPADTDDDDTPLASGDWVEDMMVSEDNILYALSSDGDVARYLIRDTDAGGNQSQWDIAWSTAGFTDELWITPGSNVLWTIDFSNDLVKLLDDVLTDAVSGITVTGVAQFTATVSWNAMDGATDYELRFYYWDGTTWAAYGPSYYTSLTTFTHTNLFPNATDYIVNVRVNNDGSPGTSTSATIGTEVEYSRWNSDDFVTLYYMTMPIPTNPGQGADEVSLTPSFGWSAVDYAVTYNFELSADPSFATLIDSVAVEVTAYTYAGDGLDWDTDYYWRVQAVGPDGTESEWSTFTETFYYLDLPFAPPMYDPLIKWVSGAISNFHTEEEEIPPVTVEPAPTPTLTVDVNIPEIVVPDITVEPPAITVPLPEQTVTSVTNVIQMPDEPTPVYIWLIVAIGAVLTIAVIVLIIRTRRVV